MPAIGGTKKFQIVLEGEVPLDVETSAEGNEAIIQAWINAQVSVALPLLESMRQAAIKITPILSGEIQ